MEEQEPTPIAVPDGLRGLDPAAVSALRDARVELERLSGLDERTIELVRLGALSAEAARRANARAHEVTFIPPSPIGAEAAAARAGS